MMSRWTHSLCPSCWERLKGNRPPVTAVDKQYQNCCLCGGQHKSGIFVRGNPTEYICKGEHK